MIIYIPLSLLYCSFAYDVILYDVVFRKILDPVSYLKMLFYWLLILHIYIYVFVYVHVHVYVYAYVYVYVSEYEYEYV